MDVRVSEDRRDREAHKRCRRMGRDKWGSLHTITFLAWYTNDDSECILPVDSQDSFAKVGELAFGGETLNIAHRQVIIRLPLAGCATARRPNIQGQEICSKVYLRLPYRTEDDKMSGQQSATQEVQGHEQLRMLHISDWG
jgi:hypothetical protein